MNDLPDQYRTVSPACRLSDRECAEGDVITDALRRCNGNKSRVALELGISRTTLYARLRALHISDSVRLCSFCRAVPRIRQYLSTGAPASTRRSVTG
ncbi:helix-turn-helix domain-containing protein [Nocardia sp. NPDC004860]|uniref:helix-turn-helix domain-containing protein n=1 Tax=Nocardia sp. NPDC004860 TaxID=3154557 RepID=UPI0033A9E7F2